MLLTFVMVHCLALGPAPGQLHPALTCRADAQQTYALYLPKAYAEDRLWPVLFVFSPTGEGASSAAMFQAGAERLGWIVIASNTARNGPWAPVRVAQAALWKEAFSELKADPSRVYAAGFSGAARMAMELAENHSRQVLGIISVGAYGTGRTLGPSHLAHVLLCGEEDPNHAEQASAWERMRKDKNRLLWMESYPGGHQWAPPHLLEEGMVFLDLAAGLQGRQARQAAAEEAFLLRRLEAARASGPDADQTQPRRRWMDVLALPGTPSEAEQRVKSLVKDPAVQSAMALEASFRERSRDLRMNATYGAELHRLLAVASRPGPEALDARRLLERERGAVEERCQEALQNQDWASALKLGRGLVALGDRAHRAGVYVAMALAQLGRKEEALKELQAAFERGYQPRLPLADIPLLAPLRESVDFKAMEAIRH